MVKVFVHGLEFDFEDLKKCHDKNLLQSFIAQSRCMFCFKKMPKECLDSNCQPLFASRSLKFVMKEFFKAKADTKPRPVKRAEGKENNPKMSLQDNLTTQFTLKKGEKKVEAARKTKFQMQASSKVNLKPEKQSFVSKIPTLAPSTKAASRYF